MPLYEYRCRNCDHRFEIQQSFSDDPLTICPECQGELRKVFNPVGISFKGSGFYKNDSRGSSSSPSSGDSATTSSTSSSDSSSSGSSSSGSSGAKEPSTSSSSSSTTASD